jgi:hypothetical protein
MDFADFFLDTGDPTLAAIIAWREFESRARDYLLRNRSDKTVKEVHDLGMGGDLFALLPSLGADYTYGSLWKDRNRVVHDDYEMPLKDAEKVVRGVEKFIEGNALKFGPR